ncbi:MAG: hypothetical protein ACRC1M_07130 [Methanobacteriaceae archaeon]
MDKGKPVKTLYIVLFVAVSLIVIFGLLYVGFQLAITNVNNSGQEQQSNNIVKIEGYSFEIPSGWYVVNNSNSTLDLSNGTDILHIGILSNFYDIVMSSPPKGGTMKTYNGVKGIYTHADNGNTNFYIKGNNNDLILYIVDPVDYNGNSFDGEYIVSKIKFLG